MSLKATHNDLFIRDDEIYTKSTLRSFKNEYMERAFDDDIMITLDNKIIEYRLEEQEDIKHKEDMDMNW